MLFFRLCSDLLRTIRPFFCTSCLCQAKSEGMRAARGLELEIPAGQAPQQDSVCNIQYIQATSYCLPKQAQRKKTKTKNISAKNPNKNLSPQSLTTHGLALSCTSASSKASWERWVGLSREEITRAEQFYLLSLLWQLKFVHVRKTGRPHLLGLVRAMRKEETFPPQSLSAQRGVIYTEPPTHKELKTDYSISLRHTSLADNPVQ